MNTVPCERSSEPATKQLRYTLLGWRINDAELDRSFRARYSAVCVAPAKFYSAVWLLLSLSAVMGYAVTTKGVGFYASFFPLVLSAFLAASCFHPGTQRHMELLLTIVVILLTLFNAGTFYLNMQIGVPWNMSRFSSADYNTNQIHEIQTLCSELLTWLLACVHIILHLPQLFAMLYLSADQLIAVISVVSFLCTLLLSPHVVALNAFLSCGAVSFLSLIFFFFAFQFKRFLMLHYLAGRELERSFEASRKADSVLNHSLKNRMADAAGEVELFLDTYDGPHQVLLECVSSLRRGMQLCQHRQAYVDLAAGQYAPRLTLSSLHDFGLSLASGRKLVKKEFSRASAAFDPIACEMILENALSNAFNTDAWTVNRVSPARPPLTDEYIRRLVTRSPCRSESRVPVSSDHLGLSHCFMIARVCGITLSLNQHADVVTFVAEVIAEVRAEGQTLPSAESANEVVAIEQDGPVLPVGLCFHFLDDSAVARRLVVSQLMRFAAPVSVKAFGESHFEVEEFVSASINVADIVIMDENLVYASGTYLGSDLLVQFVEQGFRGLLCTRSANCSAEDVDKYHSKGAHCVLMKDMSGWEMMKSIAHSYRKLLQEQCAPSRRLMFSRQGII
eukprot:CAMPEP_0174335302 /NCGR_PEP_ID=MMETSP0810-20121108/20663_1 /TAXON_ID=73025 ORGANISM="Eutreptiella gymnastica-like, Strain CCMP1594" /NCGR_SAMPLE_ID=MMETSP0810 /ASSEMBLY_ACC=CAM_ASM_000659 /LENGTH=618 /DNA_ID=CAMNT_0015453577 /DNA_START=13 /DNA_END=1870 /DNA_ORIENTATION=+